MDGHNHTHSLDDWITQRGLDAIADPLYVYTCDGTVVAGNRASEEFWNVPREALIGKFNLLHNSELLGEDAVAQFRHCLETAKPVSTPPMPITVSENDELPTKD
ncbi:MAG: PAS domain-containing protein, partial [Nannocystaceae bacterium]